MDRDIPINTDRWLNDHADALYAYAILRLHDEDRAADVVQETFLEALKARESFRGRSSERTWLIGILKHKIIDQFRSRALRGRGVGGGDQPDPESEFFDGRGAWRAGGTRWAELPVDELVKAEFWEALRASIAAIPEAYAEAFTLCELESLPGPEVCKILGITPTNLWARLHRARLMLRRELDARWFGRDRD